jgi:hypothetical protein
MNIELGIERILYAEFALRIVTESPKRDGSEMAGLEVKSLTPMWGSL